MGRWSNHKWFNFSRPRCHWPSAPGTDQGNKDLLTGRYRNTDNPSFHNKTLLCDFSPPFKTLLEHVLDIATVLSSSEMVIENPSRPVLWLLTLRDYASAAVRCHCTFSSVLIGRPHVDAC